MAAKPKYVFVIKSRRGGVLFASSSDTKLRKFCEETESLLIQRSDVYRYADGEQAPDRVRPWSSVEQIKRDGLPSEES